MEEIKVVLIFSVFIFQCSVMKIKVLDASGPPGLPSLLATALEATTAISALSFSPDGEVLLICG
jgi:hypothetical protein